MNALWLVLMYFSLKCPLVRFRVASIRLLLFFIFLYVIIIAIYHPFSRSESLVFLVTLYLALFLRVYQSGRSASSGTSIFNSYFRNKKFRPHQSLGNLGRLPIELRLQIYFEVLGGKVIHIVQPPRNDNAGQLNGVSQDLPGGQKTLELLRMLCNSLYKWITDHRKSPYIFKATQAIVDDNTQAYSLEGYLEYVDLPSQSPRYCHLKDAIPLLLTSRAVYSEALDLLYKTNTFMFWRFYNLLGFSQSIPCDSWHSIRSLRIEYTSAGHPIIPLQRHDGRRSLSQAGDIIRSMSGLRDLKMHFKHPWKAWGHLDNKLSMSEAVRREPKLLRHFSGIQLRSGEKWELTVNWPPPSEERTYTSFYITRMLGRRASEMT